MTFSRKKRRKKSYYTLAITPIDYNISGVSRTSTIFPVKKMGGNKTCVILTSMKDNEEKHHLYQKRSNHMTFYEKEPTSI
jgi:hypothetical protein